MASLFILGAMKTKKFIEFNLLFVSWFFEGQKNGADLQG